MRLVQLKIQNFRLLNELSLSVSDRLNFFYGANAAGKTTLLESIYCLGRGKSFRGSTLQELAGEQGRQWSLFGRVERDHRAPDSLGLGWTPKSTDIHVNSEAANTLDLVRSLPIQILEPGMHKVLQDGPTYRRGFLDWGVFHVEQSFIPIWRRYRRALKQRNQVLRQGGSDHELSIWEPELAETGSVLNAFRQTHLDSILPYVNQRTTELLQEEGTWAFELHRGWGAEDGLAQVLAKHRDRDRRMGMTIDGPHRAELRIRAGDHSARNRISRGQQKLLIAALLLAQCEHVHRTTGVPPVLLVDDFGAELADHYQQSLFAQLEAYPGQKFVTGFEPNLKIPGIGQSAMFHVERGRIRPA